MLLNIFLFFLFPIILLSPNRPRSLHPSLPHWLHSFPLSLSHHLHSPSSTLSSLLEALLQERINKPAIFFDQKQQSGKNMQMGSGLTRYRSAPSSYFSSFLNNPSSDGGGFGADDFARLFNPRASSPETQRIFTRFMNSENSVQENCSQNMNLQPQPQPHLNSQFLPPKIEPETEPEPELPPRKLQRQQSNDYSAVSQMIYPSQSSVTANSAINSSYSKQIASINSNSGAQIKIEGGGGGGGNSGLIRQSSSPAGLFANINIEDFSAMRSYGAGNIANVEGTFSSASRFSNPMAPISEIKGENIPVDGQFDPWDDSAVLSDDFLKELVEDDLKAFPKPSPSNENDQNNEVRSGRPPRLSHHMSLPQSSMEKLLQDSVPCRLRAKRGCATHPRSVAERVRRTKISERMRKLQELVPNMEKQTNTSDMLDFAVDYIKDLQTQLKALSDNRAKCSCSTKKKS